MTETRQETAAGYLREAADELRASAGAATPGPWRSDYSPWPCVTSANPRHPIIAEYGATWDDSEYIAIVHPGVGLAVADLLVAIFDDYDDTREVAGYAVSVAAAVLGRSWPS